VFLGATALLFSLRAFAQSEPLTAGSGASLEPVRAVHDGSIRDLDAIGSRNVGCGRGLGNWYSLETQIAEGKNFAQEIESSSKMVTDPAITEYVNRLGQNLVRNSDARVPFTIKVIDSDEVNAFTLPGGFFYVNSGLILAADNEAELAGVMAHEIAHVAACHAARGQTRSRLANLATIPFIFVGGGLGYAALEAVSVGLPMSFLKFSRTFEAQADFLGVQYMYAAGYDPQAFVAFFEKIEAKEKKKPGTLAKVFATHPPTPERMKKSQDEIATLLPERAQYILDTSEFDEVKDRLAALENGQRIRSPQDQGRPTLRRGPQPKDADDGPTLKRRNDEGGASGSQFRF
jgi:predicted Zn-dependent protease